MWKESLKLLIHAMLLCFDCLFHTRFSYYSIGGEFFMQRSNTMKDRISELPDEILVHILSFLSLRNAARSGILSRRWRHLWKSVPSLNFDFVNKLGPGRDSKGLNKYQFVDWVNAVLDLYQGKSLDEFRIHCTLGVDLASSIDSWIHFAIDKKVKRMDLDFLTRLDFFPVSLKYTFPSCNPVETVTSVEYVSLSSCILTLPGIGKFRSLKHLFLDRVELVDEVLQHLLSNCSSLEYLNLQRAAKLVSVKVDASSSKLKCLMIYYCLSLKCVDIYASNLITFTYVGHKVDLKSAPSLTEVSFCVGNHSCEDRLTYAGVQFAGSLHQLEKLVLQVSPHEVSRGIGVLPTLCNLKVLVLWVSSKEDSVTAFIQLLDLSPLLRRLELHLMYLRSQPGPSRTEITSESVHRQLEEVEVGGFFGFEDEIQLLEHVVKNAVALKKIVIDPCRKDLSASGKSVEAGNSFPFNSRLQTARKHAQHFCERIPPSINVVIL
ncbi:hypothetical protein QUC31_001397 [Theobroma cacao]